MSLWRHRDTSVASYESDHEVEDVPPSFLGNGVRSVVSTRATPQSPSTAMVVVEGDTCVRVVGFPPNALDEVLTRYRGVAEIIEHTVTQYGLNIKYSSHQEAVDAVAMTPGETAAGFIYGAHLIPSLEVDAAATTHPGKKVRRVRKAKPTTSTRTAKRQDHGITGLSMVLFDH